MNKCRSKEARKNRDGREERIQEGRIIGEVYSKGAVWMEQWKV